ncbi:amidase [Dethiosulfatibacter aminovorans DSM 17477]|uniref:Amidase n=1 Tax=Dethiosulfatibacter aminovorans DSM 17477 TaxID=1121476 RepID=A0A1M6DRA2_9FIRM|nr:acetamidase/formamidase family protein [Dethiosulfatibacter aminovorans]SHI75784.1 amidase [Dethiosulfatibacter aminovorans DSM 17477]
MIIDKYVYTFSPDNSPIIEIEKGDSVVFKTIDCFSNQIYSDEQLISDVNYDKLNPSTGPVYIRNAEVGDIVVVNIVDISVSDHGVVSSLPEIGPLSDRCDLKTKIIRIEENIAYFNDLELSINPMIGVIGLAPQERSIPTGFPGKHGGNMDCKIITKGSTVYLPVNTPGGLLQIGDLHAVMGDGEVCGTGLEVAGKVTVKIDLIKQFEIKWPIVETNDKWYVITSASDYAIALKHASEVMQKLLEDAYGWDKTDVYLYMSLQGDVEICQGCKPCSVDLVLRLGIPKVNSKKRLIWSE